MVRDGTVEPPDLSHGYFTKPLHIYCRRAIDASRQLLTVSYLRRMFTTSVAAKTRL